MARCKKLFALADKIKKENIGIILIQINEAHSEKWPIGLEYHPTIQKDFAERVERANDFVRNSGVPYPVFVDDWENSYENRYQAWPDKYYFVNVETKKVLKKSEYGSEGENDGVIVEDYADLLEKITSK